MSLMCRMVKPLKQRGQLQGVVPQFDTRRISDAALIQAHDFQAVANEGVKRIPVFEVKKVQAAAEYLCMMVHLKAKPPARVQPSKALFETFNEILLHIGAKEYIP
jgi:hypothetical protein